MQHRRLGSGRKAVLSNDMCTADNDIDIRR
uniref:Uncharacterized protein n=1 Tax=Siphoviridae sp. ctnFo11 TaxID=2826454 RepID=A0A8S5N4V4_9CAUD|nr:MAG TPA: hypothetical protein [Siphoviridae sp. ctnFo11]